MSHCTVAIVLTAMMASIAHADLKISNIKARHGHHGPERASLEAVPGDEVVFSFQAAGVEVDVTGKVDLELRFQVADPSGKALLDNKNPIKEKMALGGSQVPSFATVKFGPRAAAGDYQVTVTVTDKVSDKSASFQRKITVLKPTFAIVQPRFFHDKDGQSPASLSGNLGHRIFFRLLTVGYDRSQKKINQTLTVQFLDDKGNELMPEPLTVKAATEDEAAVAKAESITFNGSFSLNRVGSFKVRFTVKDETNDRTATFEAPLKVVE